MVEINEVERKKKKELKDMRTTSETSEDFPGGSDGKASVYNVGDPGSSPGLGRSPWRRKWM